MIDARKQVGDALSAVCRVTMDRPEGRVSLPLIVYGEAGNAPVNLAYDRIRWRVTVYAASMTELIALTAAADAVMSSDLGYTRTSKTPDADSRISQALYSCRMDYVGVVNTRTHTIISGVT